jgi:hypothetical protein
MLEYKTMKTKGKRKEKQRALLKVWLIHSRFLATLIHVPSIQPGTAEGGNSNCFEQSASEP